MDIKKDFAIKLFKKSPLKQRKFNIIKKLLPNYNDKECLDIGSDNGVISYLLRKNGGKWCSADLVPETVKLIKELVNDNVFEVNDKNPFPFEDKKFDIVVIVDFLEHVNNDKFVINEINRILKDNGELIINVPNPINGLIRFLKFKTGYTDAAHGHVRAGYNLNEIKELTKDSFSVTEYKKYGRCFSDFVDFLIIFALRKLQGNKDTKKGTVVGSNDINKYKKSFKIFSLIYPFLKFVVFLDSIFFFLPTNMLTVKLKKK